MRRALSRSFTCHSVQAKVIGQNLIRKTIFGTLCSPPYLVMSHNWKAYCTCLVASTHAHAGYEFLHLIGADSSEQDHCNSLCIYIYLFGIRYKHISLVICSNVVWAAREYCRLCSFAPLHKAVV